MDMKEKLTIPYPILVEGKYDRIRLLDVVDPSAQIIKTDGFGIFNKNETAALIRALAQKSRIIVLTDSDGAGKLIRSHITSMIASERLIHLYVPRIAGTEKRKNAPSAEGILGVEGMENDLLRHLFAPYENADAVSRAMENPLSKTDLFVDGLTGGEGSVARRDALAQKIGLPSGMTPNAFLSALRVLCTYEEYLDLVGRT